MLPRAPPPLPHPPLPLAFKSISGAKMFESLICDAIASLAAAAAAGAVAAPDAAVDPADDGNDVELLILPAPSVSWLLSDICLFFYCFAFALVVDVVSRSLSSLFSFKRRKNNLSTAYLVMHSEEVVKNRSKDWKRNRISWKRKKKKSWKGSKQKKDLGNEKGKKLKISFHEKVEYVCLCVGKEIFGQSMVQCRKKGTRFWDFPKKNHFGKK